MVKASAKTNSSGYHLLERVDSKESLQRGTKSRRRRRRRGGEEKERNGHERFEDEGQSRTNCRYPCMYVLGDCFQNLIGLSSDAFETAFILGTSRQSPPIESNPALSPDRGMFRSFFSHVFFSRMFMSEFDPVSVHAHLRTMRKASV